MFAKIIVKHQRLSGQDVPEVLAEKQQIIRKSGLLEYCATTETFSHVGGLAVLKDWLNKRAAAFTDEARAFGLPAPKGILMLGVQGCGKSLCAKAVSTQWQLPLLRFDMGRMFGTFLTWLSEKAAPVFVVATANDISQLPPELLRKGRLDEIFFVDLPEVAEREEIFRIHLAKRGRQPAAFDTAACAAASPDLSGAEIEEAINSALYDAFHAGCEVTTAHILAALAQTVPLAKTMDEQISRLRHWADGRARNASVARSVAGRA